MCMKPVGLGANRTRTFIVALPCVGYCRNASVERLERIRKQHFQSLQTKSGCINADRRNCSNPTSDYTVNVLSPMVERELRVGLLRRKVRQHWMRAAWSAGGITLFFMLFMALGSSSSPGRALFRFLFVLACFGVVTRGFGLTADLFSEERRNGTLGLLVLTGLTPMEIFANKLFGAALLTSYGLLGSLPFFAIPFLAGGVSAAQFLGALIFLTNALLFCVALGLLASVVHRDGGQAQITAIATAAILCLAAPMGRWMTVAFFGRAAASQTWLASSPAYPGYLAFTGFRGGLPRQFWDASAIMLCYSLFSLLLAAAILQRTWRDSPETETQGSFRSRWQAWLTSTQFSSRKLRIRLLAQNPFAWVVARNRGPALVAQIYILTVTLLYLGLFCISGQRWLTIGNALLASAVMHLGLNWIIAYGAAKRFAEERQSGGFEVLLTTPLSVWELVEGQSKGLIVLFKTTACLTAVADIVFAGSSFFRGGWGEFAIFVYGMVWIVVILLWFSVHLDTACRAMWISAWTGRPGYSAVQAMRAYVWTLFWLGFIGQGAFRARQTLPFGLFFIPLFTLGVFGNRRMVREKLTRELRDIAAAPIPTRNDKRFKGWDPNRIFPPGRWGYFELHATSSISKRSG